MMKCAICGIEIDSVEKAIDKGWIPSFYEGEQEHGLVCSGCSESLLKLDGDREFELKEECEGKIIYQDEDTREHLAMWVMFR